LLSKYVGSTVLKGSSDIGVILAGSGGITGMGLMTAVEGGATKSESNRFSADPFATGGRAAFSGRTFGCLVGCPSVLALWTDFSSLLA
jgi:hypothetical protein